MPSIFQLCLDDEYARLHPAIQQRFGLTSGGGYASIGKGMMNVRVHPLARFPMLYIAAKRHMALDRSGLDIPFTIENYAYVDEAGREAMASIRTFYFPEGTRRFDTTTVYLSDQRRLVDLMGTHQQLAVDLQVEPAANGGIILRTGAQRWCSPVGLLKLPSPMSGHAWEWYDPADKLHHIEVSVHLVPYGKLIAYQGEFRVEHVQLSSEAIPEYALPKRVERRV